MEDKQNEQAQKDTKYDIENKIQPDVNTVNNNGFDVIEAICLRVSVWRAFARVLDFPEDTIQKAGHDIKTTPERTKHFMEMFCNPDPIPNYWLFWRKHLLGFEEGRMIIKELENEFVELSIKVSGEKLSYQSMDCSTTPQPQHVSVENEVVQSDMKQSILTNNDNQQNFINEILSLIYDWKAFARVLKFPEHKIRIAEVDIPETSKRNEYFMSMFCSPNPILKSWSFWRKYLLEFDNGRLLIKELETKFVELMFDGDSKHICHESVIGRNVLLSHQYSKISRDKRLEIDMTKLIKVNVGPSHVKILCYQDYNEWMKTKEIYKQTYKIFKDMKTLDLSGNFNECMILRNIENIFEETNDNGFAVKGYSIKNHYSLFGKKFYREETSTDTIFVYLSNSNAVLHISFCNDLRDMGKLLNGGFECFQLSEVVHKCLKDSNFIHINVIVYNRSSIEDKYLCKDCCDKHLLVSKDVLLNYDNMKQWLFNILQNSKELENLEDQSTSLNTVDASMISENMKHDIIAFSALQSYDILPTFTWVEENQMNELKKLVLLTPCQFQVLHSKSKRILIKGGYGSGKSLVLQKKFEQVLSQTSVNDKFYLICHDQQSQFANQMAKLKEKYSNRKIIVCNSHSLVKKTLDLSSILHAIKEIEQEGVKVNVFIDEFNGKTISKNEISKLESIKYFNNSYIVIAAQSMELRETYVEDYCRGFHYRLLMSKLNFEIHKLRLSLRCSFEINSFVNACIDKIKGLNLISMSKNPFTLSLEGDRVVDNESNYKFTNISTPAFVTDRKFKCHFKFNQPQRIGHDIHCGKVNIYNFNRYTQRTNLSQKCDNIYLIHLLIDFIINNNLMDERFVISTFDEDFYSKYHHILNYVSENWTDNISEFNKYNSKYKILFTDSASMRGYEFENVIFILDSHLETFNCRIMECFTRATSHLYIIVNVAHYFSDGRQRDMILSLKGLDSVINNQLKYNKRSNSFQLKTPSKTIDLKEDHPELRHPDFSEKWKFPWRL